MILKSQRETHISCFPFRSVDGFKVDAPGSESHCQQQGAEAEILSANQQSRKLNGNELKETGLKWQEELKLPQKEELRKCQEKLADKVATSGRASAREQLEDGRQVRGLEDGSKGDSTTSAQKIRSPELDPRALQRAEEKGQFEELDLKHRLLEAEEKAVTVQHEVMATQGSETTSSYLHL